jgi:flagellin
LEILSFFELFLKPSKLLATKNRYYKRRFIIIEATVFVHCILVLEGENMVIQSNISAANASRQYGIANKNISVSMEKLSSGYRINRAADDAAGLSISENMRKQIRGLSRGVDNTQDGVSLCQVADGALSEMTDMIQRLNELSVQAANGTNSTSDRRAIQNEIDQITDDVDRISESTTFNGQKIFDGQPVYIGGGYALMRPQLPARP